MEKASEHSDLYSPNKTVPLKQSILVIDDSPDTLNLSKFVLELGGFEVVTAQSGTEALLLLSQIKQPSLILLDMQLGDMVGTELLRKIEESKPEIIKHVPVVFLTGMDEVPKSKAIGFIRKPADTAHFLKSINHFIEVGPHASDTH